MSKRVQFAHSYPVLPSAPAAEPGRSVFYAAEDGLYYVKADGTAVGPLGAGGGEAPTNMVTTDTDQTITGHKTFTDEVMAYQFYAYNEFGDAAIGVGGGTERYGSCSMQPGRLVIDAERYEPNNSAYILFRPWNGVQNKSVYLEGVSDGLGERLVCYSPIYESGNRVYSAANPPPAPPAPTNMVTTDTDQTITGEKTFDGTTRFGEVDGTSITGGNIYSLSVTASDIYDASGDIPARVYSASNPPPAPPAPDLSGYVTTSDPRLTDARTPTAHTQPASTISDSTTVGRSVLTATDAAAARTAIGAGTSSFSGAYGDLSGRPTLGTLASVTPTGTASGTTFLAGDNTYKTVLTAAPSNMLTTDTTQTVTGVKTLQGAAMSDRLVLEPTASATSSATSISSPAVTFVTRAWSGSGSVNEVGTLTAIRGSAAPGDYWLQSNPPLRAFTLHETTGGTAARVYSPNNRPSAAAISDSTVVGRAVLTAADAAAARSAIGAGTSSFSGVYGDLSGRPTLGNVAGTTASTVGINVLTAADAAAARSAIGAGTSSFSGAYADLSGKPTLGTLSAMSPTGTASNTTYLRGDGAWASVPAGGTTINQQPDAPAPAVGTLWLDTDEPSDPNAAIDTTAFLTTNTAQTITGLKTIGNGEFDFTRMNAEPAAPAANSVTLFAINDANGITRMKLRYSDGTTASMRAVEPYVMAVTGNLTVTPGKSRVYLEDNYVIETIRASVNTAPAGASIIVDVNLNGTSIFTTQANRPTIAAGANTALAGAPDTISVAAGQYITVDVDQIGTTTAGADLTVVLRLRRI